MQPCQTVKHGCCKALLTVRFSSPEITVTNDSHPGQWTQVPYQRLRDSCHELATHLMVAIKDLKKCSNHESVSMLPHWEIKCLNGKAAICGTRLLSVSKQVGAHLWRKGPAGGLSGIWIHNLQALLWLYHCAISYSYLQLKSMSSVNS